MTYSDRILHFSHFKILEDSRDTCFLDEPHKCPNLNSDANDQDRSDQRDEL
jgi:hypothetical protein